MKKSLVTLLALVIQAYLCSQLVTLLWGSSNTGPIFGVLLIASLVIYPILILTVRRLDPRVWIFAGFLVLTSLSLPSAMLVEFGHNLGATLPGWFATPFQTGLVILPAAAVAVAALLLYVGLNFLEAQVEYGGSPETASVPDRDPVRRKLAFSALVLSAALVGKTLHNLYWLTAWDNTYDPIEFFWLLPPLIAALASGGVLMAALPGKKKLAGLYSVVVSALLIAVSVHAQQIDFRRLNAQRAEQVSQAVESFYRREGRYPKRLAELVPRHLLFVPPPFIIYGQDWCYDQGPGYYRLGYVDRDHWSSPNFTGQVYRLQGLPANLPPVCEPEVAALKLRFPNVYSKGSQSMLNIDFVIEDFAQAGQSPSES